MIIETTPNPKPIKGIVLPWKAKPMPLVTIPTSRNIAITAPPATTKNELAVNATDFLPTTSALYSKSWPKSL